MKHNSRTGAARALLTLTVGATALTTMSITDARATEAQTIEPDPAASLHATWSLGALTDFGVQAVAKQDPTADAITAGEPTHGVNPYLTSGDPSQVDYHYWRTVVDERGEQRAAADTQRTEATASAVELVDELEPSELIGANDVLATGQPIAALGTGEGEQSEVRILGTLAAGPGAGPVQVGPFAEDDGSFLLASPVGLDGTSVSVRAAATIGDGPHGTAGTGTGDFDVFRIDDVEAGQVLTVDIDTGAAAPSDLDAQVVVAGGDGTVLAVNDDDATSQDSFLQVTLPTAGTIFVAVTAFGSLPTNPFDSGSGTGAATEGPYEIQLGLDIVEDVDVFRFDLAAGDIVGASVSGSAHVLGLFDPAQRQVMGSAQDLSALHPEDTQLLGGGNAVLDHIAAAPGTYSLVVSRGVGDYEARMRLRRPALESAAPGTKQILFLDFDGEELNTNIFAADLGAPGGVRTLSPMAGFLGGCGVATADVDTVIDGVVDAVTENFVDDLGADIEIRNSRDDADPWGQPNVSRVIIGGTRTELGNPGAGFNGIAQSIDPGNFDAEETAVVLMDQLCAPSGSVPVSVNDLIGPDSDVVGFVGRGIGFVVSHEAGHLFGNWHTRNNDGVASIMDQFDLTQLGLGADGFGGTSDDIDVDFVEDEFNPFERFTGLEDTANRPAAVLLAPALDLPAAPADVDATVVGHRAVRVSWARVDEPVTSYTVSAVDIISGAVVASEQVAPSRSSVRFRRLEPGTYVFDVAAFNDAGEGPATRSEPVVVRGQRRGEIGAS